MQTTRQVIMHPRSAPAVPSSPSSSGFLGDEAGHGSFTPRPPPPRCKEDGDAALFANPRVIHCHTATAAAAHPRGERARSAQQRLEPLSSGWSPGSGGDPYLPDRAGGGRPPPLGGVPPPQPRW